MIRPDYNEIERFAKEYGVIPVCREIYADITTPIAILRRISQTSDRYFLLESIEGGEKWGRYSFLGCDPLVRITCINGEIKIEDGAKKVQKSRIQKSRIQKSRKPYEALRTFLSRYRAPALEGMPPFAGGLVGYFSYSMIGYAEDVLKLRNSGFHDFDLMLYDKVIAYDHLKQKISIVVNIRTDKIQENYQKAIADIEDIICMISSQAVSAASEAGDAQAESAASEAGDAQAESAASEAGGAQAESAASETGDAQTVSAESPRERVQSEAPVPEARSVPRFTCNVTKDEYCSMVEKAKENIRNGDIFQAVISRRFETEYRESLLNAYRVLRTTNPSPYMVCMKNEDVQLISASPETLVRLHNGILSTFPIAGSRPRGQNTPEDQALEKELLEDGKELAEHNMLVDLARNDLGKISKCQSVQVAKYKTIQRYSRIMHITSEVEGLIREDMDALDAIEALLPAGTLSGAPKIRACEIIEELEKEPRGIYGGAIGYIDFTGNMDVCIAIRMAVKKGDRVYVQAGGGIVADSVPEKEYEESEHKARAVMEAIITAREVEG